MGSKLHWQIDWLSESNSYGTLSKRYRYEWARFSYYTLSHYCETTETGPFIPISLGFSMMDTDSDWEEQVDSNGYSTGIERRSLRLNIYNGRTESLDEEWIETLRLNGLQDGTNSRRLVCESDVEAVDDNVLLQAESSDESYNASDEYESDENELSNSSAWCCTGATLSANECDDREDWCRTGATLMYSSDAVSNSTSMSCAVHSNGDQTGRTGATLMSNVGWEGNLKEEKYVDDSLIQVCGQEDMSKIANNYITSLVAWRMCMEWLMMGVISLLVMQLMGLLNYDDLGFWDACGAAQGGGTCPAAADSSCLDGLYAHSEDKSNSEQEGESLSDGIISNEASLEVRIHDNSSSELEKSEKDYGESY